MYVPAPFAANAQAIAEILAHPGAADLVTVTATGPTASVVPFVLDPDRGPRGALLGHLARGNDQWRTGRDGPALVIVGGPDAYISPSWYAAKAEHGRVVPTWDYLRVHVHGRLRVHDDPAWLADVLRCLTDTHEAAHAEPWSVDDAPPDYLATMLRAVVGIEVLIERVEAAVKLSQNRPPADVDGVLAGLRARGEHATADAVAHHRPPIPPTEATEATEATQPTAPIPPAAGG
ncbi:negative transcriptional regulator, PaiB family [Frankia torreyi]|uniref:Negative transcriptional regulator, PaiB family n=1 Tax=Frankia torreyi TaxID=1856 RepID=A0A0D8BMI8_9ACTN|nr:MULTISPECIES: FMN-binding negative transcriptional regulator [Frankia]KJE25209.1 negative transcriptional regulator, PaiB family [Frankia torreyi]KQM07975.1 negative transcriptional regulator, PaiB family [Frankia sp. CpI1-P]